MAAGQQAAEADKLAAIARFRSWAATLVEDARYMNVTSGPQIRQLLFAGVPNKNKDGETLEMERVFKVRSVFLCQYCDGNNVNNVSIGAQ